MRQSYYLVETGLYRKETLPANNAACIAKEMYEEVHPGRQAFVIDSLSAGPELPQVQVTVGRNLGLCRYYAERGGMLVGYEKILIYIDKRGRTKILPRLLLSGTAAFPLGRMSVCRCTHFFTTVVIYATDYAKPFHRNH